MASQSANRKLNIIKKKSLEMKTSFFKSTEADFKKSVINEILEVMAKNILHLTYQNDRILKLLSGSVQTPSAETFYNKDEEPEV